MMAFVDNLVGNDIANELSRSLSITQRIYGQNRAAKPPFKFMLKITIALLALVKADLVYILHINPIAGNNYAN